MGLNIENVNKSFGNKKVVSDLSFIIDEPGIFGLLGTNGAGKTTTIRMILGILDKGSGKIGWNGEDIKRENIRFGYLPEERGIYPKAKIGEQLLYFAKLRGMSGKDAKLSLDYWTDRLKVTEYAQTIAEKLSKGNQQKIQLISAIIHNPELIILDEPFSGLDPVNTDLFKSIIEELLQKGKYIIMSSHQMQAVEEYCREILILDEGKTVLSGNLKDIKHSYGRTNLFIDCDGDITKLANQEGITKIILTATGFELKISADEEAYRLLYRIIKAGLRLDKFEIREPSLHEIFVEIVGEHK
ncbi:MAG TPA: ATP-binding cassette domain-containing protein [Clostridia bacterium]|nr:ATP-binding cassette domain-containing protein [Clostridia bacterium]